MQVSNEILNVKKKVINILKYYLLDVMCLPVQGLSLETGYGRKMPKKYALSQMGFFFFVGRKDWLGIMDKCFGLLL